MGQRYHKLLVAIVRVGDILSIVAFPSIAMGIVAADLPRSVAQHVAVTIELIALESLRSIVLLAGEHKAPGDAFALIEQNHLRVRQLRYREYGIGELCIAGKIGEERLFRQLQHYLVTNDIKFVAGNLILYGSHEIDLTAIRLYQGVVLWEDAAAIVHIHRTTLARIIDVSTNRIEGKTVIIHTPVCLVARGCTPPVAAVGTRLTATHMSLLSVVDAPCAGDTVVICRKVHLRVLKCKLLADAGLTETVTVAETQFHVVGSCLAVRPVHGVQRRVGATIDLPDGVGLCRQIGSESSLVHALVYIHIEVHTRDGRDSCLVRAVELFRRAGRKGCCSTAAYEAGTE